MSLNGRKYPVIKVTAAVRAISVENLTIPTTLIKAILLGCIEDGQRTQEVWNYVSCRFDFFDLSFLLGICTVHILENLDRVCVCVCVCVCVRVRVCVCVLQFLHRNPETSAV